MKVDPLAAVFVKQPQLWAVNVMNGTNMWFDDIYVNATALSAPWGKNWVQNTDGFDTMDAHNIALTNFVYQGRPSGIYESEQCAYSWCRVGFRAGDWKPRETFN